MKAPKLLLYICFIPVIGLWSYCWDFLWLFNLNPKSPIVSITSIKEGEPPLFKKILIPSEFLTSNDILTFGGDIRMGDLTGDGQVDFMVYRSEDNAHDGGGMKPCFWGAFTQTGEVLWQQGEGW